MSFCELVNDFTSELEWQNIGGTNLCLRQLSFLPVRVGEVTRDLFHPRDRILDSFTVQTFANSEVQSMPKTLHSGPV